MRFPQDFIERVRETSNIVDIIGQYVELRRAGGNHQGLCPFHNEKSPSFSVSEDKQVYHCFGCKASGNVYSFVQQYQGMTFPEAVEYLAKRAGLPLPKVEGDDRPTVRDIKEPLHRVNALAAQFFHQRLKNLPPDHFVRKYLAQRKIEENQIDVFKLGFAPEAWTDLSDFLASKKVPTQYAEQLGLIKKRSGGKTGHYDLFRNRLMFPIFSPSRECLGFGGRVVNPEDKPKYLNSPESPVFHKGKVFYGLESSVKHIRTADELIVVEGYMDWLALAKAGIPNIAATLGTALTPDHARTVKRYTDKVLLLFDGDEAGKMAARRSLPILLEQGLLARGLFLPEELDPDEYIEEHGVEKLRTLISSAPDLFDLIASEIWHESKGSPSGKVRFLDEIGPILERTADPRLRALYVDSLSRLIDVKPILVEQSVKGRLPSPVSALKQAAPTSDGGKIDISTLKRAEQELLNVILLKEVYLKTALESGVFAEINHPGGRDLFARIAEVYRLMPNKFDTLSALLAGEVKPSEMVTRHLSEPYVGLGEDAAAKLLQDCIRRVKENFLRSKSKELVSNLRGSNPADSTDKLEQIMNIHRNRRSLNRDS